MWTRPVTPTAKAGPGEARAGAAYDGPAERKEWPLIVVRVGVTQAPREIEVELADDADRDQLARDIDEALGRPDGVLWLTDRRGRRVGVPSAKVAYIEVGAPEDRRVGFGAP